MYNEGLNSEFCKFMEEKVKYTLTITVEDILDSDLFDVTTQDELYLVKPLFNFDTVTSSNPEDHTSNKYALVLQKIDTTKLFFKSNTQIREYEELTTENTIDNIKYTLHYTYDKITGEPAPNKLTSNGNTTDENGYYLDCEVVE
jgi:hypothetical protein